MSETQRERDELQFARDVYMVARRIVARPERAEELAPHLIRLAERRGASAPGVLRYEAPPASEAEPREWLIYNVDNGQFWGSNSGGYFGLWGAGLYTEAEAKRLSSDPDRRDQVHHISEYVDQIANMRGAYERLSLAVGAATARRWRGVPHGTPNADSATKAGNA